MRSTILTFQLEISRSDGIKKLVSKNCPRRVWYFGIKHAAKVKQMIPSAKLNGRTPIEAGAGETLDISEYVDFDFYDFLWYHTGEHPSMKKEYIA